MKKLLLTLGLIGCTLASALAQGTINPLNGSLTRFKIDIDADGIGDRNATAADGFKMVVYYGPAGSSASELTMYPDVMTIGTDEGIFTGLPSILALPGTEPDQIISLQMRVSSAWGWYGETRVIQIKLGQAAGPGTVVWHPIGTADRFGPIVPIIPEPSTLALGALAGAFLLFRIRNRNSN